MKTNVKNVATPVFTHEGAKGVKITPEQELRRTVMACMLFEETAYESGASIADRIKDLIPKVKPDKVAEIAIAARSEQNLRHTPLFIVRQMARLDSHKHLVGETLPKVIQRADEITEFLAMYWKDNNGKKTLSNQVKIGLRNALDKFNEYQYGKYKSNGAVKHRDVIFLTHPTPKSDSTSITVNRKYKDGTVATVERHSDSLYGKIINNTLETPDTWEVQLSGGADKKETFTRLMNEKKLGALAFIRNLRNMSTAGVEKKLVEKYSQEVNIERVLPFRFISAATHVPQWNSMIENMMFRCLKDHEKLSGKTAVIVDNSGSMHGPKVSAKSEIDRAQAAAALAILVREICEDCLVIGYGTDAAIMPDYRGFALAEKIRKGPGGGTNTAKALKLAAENKYDRVIVITDEQSATKIPKPETSKAYFINVAPYKVGIGYGDWVHIDGWSDSVIDYIQEFEKYMSA